MARLRDATAETLGLKMIAKSAGLTWNSNLYPRVLNLHRAGDSQLRECFGGWPLPSRPVREARRSELTMSQRSQLLGSWLEVATEMGMRNVDNLPYSQAIDDIKVRFAIKSSIHLPNDDIFRFLLQQRKASQLPYPPK